MGKGRLQVLLFFGNIVSNIQLDFLQTEYLTTKGWKGGKVRVRVREREGGEGFGR